MYDKTVFMFASENQRSITLNKYTIQLIYMSSENHEGFFFSIFRIFDYNNRCFKPYIRISMTIITTNYYYY